MTQTPGSAWHAASADQSNAWQQRSLPTNSEFFVNIPTGLVDSRAARTRRLLEVACPCRARRRPLSAPARGAGAAPTSWSLAACHQHRVLMAPAEARKESRSTRQRPKANTEAVEDLEARSPKLSQNLNRSPKCSSRTKVSVKALSANRSPKCASEPEALV